MISRRGAPLAHGSSDGPVVVEAAPGVIDTWEVVLLALRLLQPGRALGRGGCCAGCGDALALAAGCGVGSTLDGGESAKPYVESLHAIPRH